MLHTFKIVFKRFFVERFFDQAAMLAYYFILSTFPFLLFVLGIVGLLPFSSGDVIEALALVMPETSFELLEGNIESIFDDSRLGIASISILPALWISSMAVQSLVRSLNDAYRLIRNKSFLRGALQDIAVTLALMFVLPFSLVIPVVEAALREVSTHIIFIEDIVATYAQIWFYFRWIVGSLVLFSVFLLVYKWLPSHRGTIRDSWGGAAFATIGILTVSNVFSYYSQYANYERFYGQLGAFIVLLIWFYLAASVILIGGLLNATRIEQKEKSD
ncbi:MULTISPECIES: YihY/virulence factor BrkB family protein [Exiguobacterium]|uniref:YihY/virulence factor BrkB family protein n=1 Tax=Exiguobacterium TaxID=33986 RepID=UPI001BE68D06|nr:YihY/virulence factor BrkB family protein [Exiguobacterium sp. s150]